MSILSTALHWNGSTGDTDTSGRRYEAHYKVMTDDPLDQTRMIVLHFKNTPDLPFIDDEYHYANDHDPDAFCVGIHPVREKGSATQWLVIVTFQTPGEEESKPDSNGKPSNNPLDWQGEYSITKLHTTVPVYEAKFLGAFQNGGNLGATPHLAVDAMGPVMSSAGRVFDPPLQRESQRQAFRGTIILAEYPTSLANSAYGTVNDREVLMPIPFTGVGQRCSKHTLKVTAFSGSLFFQNGFYYRVSIELVHDHLTWVERVVDQGFAVQIVVGDRKPGSTGENTALDTWSSAEVENLRSQGIYSYELTDPFGRPLSKPVLLNGKGTALRTGEKPVYLHYLTARESDHNQLFSPNGPF